MSSSPSPAPHADATAAVDRAIASEDTPFLLLLIGPPVSAAGTALPHVSWIDDVAADGGGGGGGGSTEVKVTDLLRTVARTLSSTPSKASPRPSVVLSSAAATADGRVRAVCAHIAQVVGVRYLVHVLAPDVWLSRDTDAVGATTTDEGGADDRWKTAMEWAPRLPGPLEYAQGVSVTTTPAYHPGEPRPGALAYRDGSIDQATSDALGGDRFLSHEGAVGVKAACARLYREIRRGVGEAHLTLMSPQELTAHLEAKQLKVEDFVACVAEEALLHTDGITEVGMGRVVREDGHWTIFLVYEWPWVQEWRAGFGLDPKDLHITLGFSDQDIFKMADGKTQVSKDASTCVW